jgi:error-prone DNA polymerase
MTLEDEFGVANIIIWPKVFERFRKQVLGARLISIRGVLQREGKVIHVIAEQVMDFSDKLAELTQDAVIGDSGLARADEVKTGITLESRRLSEQREADRKARAGAILPKSRDFH